MPIAICVLGLMASTQAHAELPNPVLHTVFPAGGQAGTSVTVALDGTSSTDFATCDSTVPGLTARSSTPTASALHSREGTTPGVYDLRALGFTA